VALLIRSEDDRQGAGGRQSNLKALMDKVVDAEPLSTTTPMTGRVIVYAAIVASVLMMAVIGATLWTARVDAQAKAQREASNLVESTSGHIASYLRLCSFALDIASKALNDPEQPSISGEARNRMLATVASGVEFLGSLVVKKIELAAVAVLAMLVALLCIHFDAFEALAEFVESHDSWQLDEYLIVLFVVGIASFVLLIRRAADLRSEVKRRTVAEAEANRLARHDALTGLPNRRLLFVELAGILEALRSSVEECAVLLLDLDHFKRVNDMYGHAAGDALLVETANRLTATVGRRGTVARLGGDEFVCIIRYDIGSDVPSRLASQIVRSLNQPFQIAGALVQSGSTVGIASAPRDGTTPAELLHFADLAMYEGKRSGRGTYQFFDAEMDDNLRQRAQLEKDLRRAVAEGAIVPYFQPIAELADGRITGFEALARWPHPILGMVPPDTFIPIAEDLGIIDQLSSVIIRAASSVACDWPTDLSLSINISPIQLTAPSFATQMLAILSETGFEPRRLIVEVTENATIENIDTAREVFLSLQSAGVRIALDDFGKGNASLYYLRQLNFDHLKIDRSFVHDMSSSESAKIVSAVAGLGKSLGMSVTAEGVETAQEAEALRVLGCELAQGYLFGKPLNARETTVLLRDRETRKEAVERLA